MNSPELFEKRWMEYISQLSRLGLSLPGTNQRVRLNNCLERLGVLVREAVELVDEKEVLK